MDRLHLKVPIQEELSYRQRILADPETMSYNMGFDIKDSSYDKSTGCIDFEQSKWGEWYSYWVDNKPQAYYAYIVRNEDCCCMGEVNIHKSQNENLYEMGIVMEEQFRGKGYSKEALALLLQVAFEEYGAKAIHNNFSTDNDAAYKTHLAVGFKYIGKKDSYFDLVITDEDYALGKIK